jgi:hypothetical protein
VISEVFDAEECPIEALQGFSSATFFYCDILFSSLSYLYGWRLQVAFNSCTRYVFGIRRFYHLCVLTDVLLGNLEVESKISG